MLAGIYIVSGWENFEDVAPFTLPYLPKSLAEFHCWGFCGAPRKRTDATESVLALSVPSREDLLELGALHLQEWRGWSIPSSIKWSNLPSHQNSASPKYNGSCWCTGPLKGRVLIYVPTVSFDTLILKNDKKEPKYSAWTLRSLECFS